MQTWCTWETELAVVVVDSLEREEIEAFVVAGRATEVPLPRVGEAMRLFADADERIGQVVQCTHAGHVLVRRTKPWIWRTRWDVRVRLRSS